MITPPDHLPDFTRVRAFCGVLLLLFSLIVARLWYLQIAQGPELREQSVKQRTRRVRRVPPRGEIVDAKGRKLATNRSRFVVSVLPDTIKEHPETLIRLATLLGVTPEEMEQTIRDNRTTRYDPIPVADDVDIALLTRIEEQQQDLPGVLITRDPKRVYAYTHLYSHVLGVTGRINQRELEDLAPEGYIGTDVVGKYGVEAANETDLFGTVGGQEIEIDAKGRLRRVVSEDKPVTGRTLQLTLDTALQQTAYNYLQEQLAKGHAGAAVALDPNDGAVLALVSTPSYDVNRYSVDFARLSGAPNKPLFNRATQAVHPCGSPFKLVTAAAGLETGKISQHTPFYCPGYIRLGRVRFNCDVRSGHGSMGFYRAVGASCNVYFWRTAMLTGPEAVADWAHRLGLGERTEIDLPAGYDWKGRIPSPSWKKRVSKYPWVPGDVLNTAIGQGDVGVTPLQLALMTSTIANGGHVLKPQIVREVRDESGPKPIVVRRLERTVRKESGMHPEVRDAIVAGMQQVMGRGGTASSIRIPGLSIAGKTGTAEAGRGREDHSWFVCFAPVDRPKIAIAVVVENGGFGADAAAPIAQRMLLNYFGMDKKPGGAESAAPQKKFRRRRYRRR